MNRRAARIAASALVVVLGVLLVRDVVREQSQPHLAAGVARHPVAPGFSLSQLRTSVTWTGSLARLRDAKRVRLADLDGRVRVINFWASWCVRCKQEQATLAHIANENASSATFVGIDVNDFDGSARRYLKRYNVPYPTLRDQTAVVAVRWGVIGLPETLVLDTHSRVVARIIGPVKARRLEGAIQRANRRSAT